MKFSMLTIAGALATANAASFRGDATATLKKMAIMQKVADAANKNAFGAVRRLENNAYITDETIIQPLTCITAKVYVAQGGGEGEGENQNMYSSGDGPYMSYLTYQGETAASNNGYEYVYGQDDEYLVTLNDYLVAIGSSWAEERANLCDDCANMQNFCQMSDEERSYFANMSEDEFTAYMEEVAQEYEEENQKQQQQANQKQQQNEEQQQQDQNNAYAAYTYGNGGRRLYESIQTLCGTCQSTCIDGQAQDQSQEYYENMEELFQEGMCTASGNYYIGHTCGSKGNSIELAMFTDENCMYMAGEQNAYSLYQGAVAQVYNQDADGDGYNDNTWSANDLAYGYMEMVTEMFKDEFSCQVGAVRSYDGSDASEACQNLYGNAVSKQQCAYGNANRKLQDNENNQYSYVPEGYDFAYSEDLYDVCKTIFSNESKYAKGGTNPFQGTSFAEMFGLNSGLSGGAIAGIVIAVIAVAAAVAVAIKKKTEKKTDLEEPVFQGGSLQ